MMSEFASAPNNDPIAGTFTRQRRGYLQRIFSGLMPAIRFLTPLGGRKDKADAYSMASAPTWFILLGILTGLAWAGTFRATWHIYGEIATLRIVPPLAVVLVECLITGPYLAMGLARTAHLLTSARPTRPMADLTAPLSPVGTLVLMLAILVQYILIASTPAASPWWPAPGDWRHTFRHLYAAPLYRPLVLAPIWGRWAILLAATIGKTAKNADVPTVELSRAMSPGRLLLQAIFPFAITSIYSSREGNYLTGVMVGLIVFVVTYLVSLVMARRGGGQSRQSLYASGQIGQLAFLAMYRAFWPLIHG